MKNKATTYVLGIAVLLVWGIIVYRIIAAVPTEDEAFAIAAPYNNKEAYDDHTPAVDTGRLSLNYRDPFGLSVQKDTSVAVIKKGSPIKTIIPPKPAFNWGFVKYSGFIRNSGAKGLLAIVSVNGRTEMLAEGEQADGVELISNRQDSIKVTAAGKTTFIKIQP